MGLWQPGNGTTASSYACPSRIQQCWCGEHGVWDGPRGSGDGPNDWNCPNASIIFLSIISFAPLNGTMESTPAISKPRKNVFLSSYFNWDSALSQQERLRRNSLSVWGLVCIQEVHTMYGGRAELPHSTEWSFPTQRWSPTSEVPTPTAVPVSERRAVVRCWWPCVPCSEQHCSFPA